MSELIQFVVPGPPFGKQRPRFTRVGRFPRAYTPKETVGYESLILYTFASAYPNHTPIGKPVTLTVHSFHPIPKSTPKRMLADMEAERVPCGKKPDLSNIFKIIEDALNGAAFVDDSLISDYGESFKRYSARPRVVVEIQEWPR